ncbi:MAG: hypothetical protein ACKO8Q_01705, partial [Bacteroidota bacterium]
MLVCIYLCWYKRWYFIPILFTGTFILNTIGGIYSGEWLWLFESNPYINTEITAYGNGSIFHFFIWGVPVFGLGFILFMSRTMSLYFKKKFWIQLVSEPFLSQQSIQVWFFHGFFWCFFLAHVMLWWLGMWASLGLTRVMFCIVGPFVLLLYQEIALSKLIVTNNKWVKMKRVGIAIGLISPVIASSAFLGLLGFPTGFGTEEVVLQKALSKSNFLQTESTAFYAHPYCATVLNRDPFDSKSCQRIENFLNAKPGDVIIWDGHFAPNEHRVNLSELQQDSSLIFLGMYAPNRAYKPLNGIPFEVYLFTK